MTAKESGKTALGRCAEIYENRSSRALELKREGKRVFGYFCCYAPLELFTAAGIIPYRIMGNAMESTSVADTYLDINFCPFVRSCFDVAMKGAYDFLDGILWPTSCDNLTNLHGVWDYNMKYPFTYSLDIPRVPDALALKFFTEEMHLLKEAVEKFIGVKIGDGSILEAIQLHNRNRALLRKLYELRKSDPPFIAGSEVTRVLVAVMSLPVAEANELIAELIQQVEDRRDVPPRRRVRLLMVGTELDDHRFIGMIEDCGADVVIDSLCVGTRYFWKDVTLDGDPMTALSRHYLQDILCSRTYRGWTGSTRLEEMEARFGQIGEMARQWKIQGALIYTLKYCDSEEWDVPDLRDYLQDKGFPVLHIEHDYSTVALAPVRNRVEAFVEMIE
ncbi:MAG: 2-hydroxyacyl-CoA dehydratase [Deltaproteobacteria bacterium]|nr:2-hydroxyacyl-CoA dehydratase [Deltaproteobacteria bacterium]